MTVWLMIMSMVSKLIVSVLAAPNGEDILKYFSYFQSGRKVLVRKKLFYAFLVSFYARMPWHFIRITKREIQKVFVQILL